MNEYWDGSLTENDEFVDVESLSPTKEDFIRFCETVLEYAGYEDYMKDLKQNKSVLKNSAIDGAHCTSERTLPNMAEGNQEEFSSQAVIMIPKLEQIKKEHDDHKVTQWPITCFCGKPYAGRAMIECSKCLTWLHLTCAKIKRTNIPEVFHCSKCKSSPDSESLTGSKATRKVISSSTVTSTTPERPVNGTGFGNDPPVKAKINQDHFIKGSLLSFGKTQSDMIKPKKQTNVVDSSPLSIQQLNTTRTPLPLIASRQSISYEKQTPPSVVRSSNIKSLSSSTNENIENGTEIPKSDKFKIKSNTKNINNNNNKRGKNHL